MKEICLLFLKYVITAKEKKGRGKSVMVLRFVDQVFIFMSLIVNIIHVVIR
jgi:hypothetical protein